MKLNEVYLSEEDVKWGIAVKARELLSLMIQTEDYIRQAIDNGVDPKVIDKAMRDTVRSSSYVNDDSELIAKFFDHVTKKIKL